MTAMGCKAGREHYTIVAQVLSICLYNNVV
jgi:hypothetical protein